MLNEYFAQHEMHNRGRELTKRAERRRLAAEGAPVIAGERLSFVAGVTRVMRAGKRPVVAHPSC